LAELLPSVRIISDILTCLYSDWFQAEPAPSLRLLREVPPWIEQLLGQALSDI